MTKRQAIDKAQALADSEGRSFAVLGVSREFSVYPLPDLDLAVVSAARAVIVPPAGRYPLASAMNIVKAVARR